MKINLVIGAGQLGSRHLQGLLKLDIDQTIYVLDPSTQSLDIARQRATEIPNNHTVNYLTSWDELPTSFDLVIIATNANVRRQLVLKLLNEFKVHNLVLEKVLFQDMQSYTDVSEIIKEKDVPVWVNHPRRMFGHYEKIKQAIASANKSIAMHVTGTNWGLGCNGLHFVDLFAFLCGSSVTDISAEWVDDQVLESKRPGYIEFTGTIKGQMQNSSYFSISSLKGNSDLLTVIISAGDESWTINEAANAGLSYQKAGSFDSDYKEALAGGFQSSLTTRVAQEIFAGGTCSLPTYEEARTAHEPFVKALLTKYIDITGVETDICPIT